VTPSGCNFYISKHHHHHHQDFVDIDDLNTDIARAGLRLLKRKNIPSLRECLSNNGIEVYIYMYICIYIYIYIVTNI
jgi:hypothetical protein